MSSLNSSRMDDVVALGQVIRRHVEDAELETAGQLAAERYRQLRVLFDDPALAVGDESMAQWLQDILREDQSLMQALADLRGRMERQRGDSAATRSAPCARHMPTPPWPQIGTASPGTE